MDNSLPASRTVQPVNTQRVPAVHGNETGRDAQLRVAALQPAIRPSADNVTASLFGEPKAHDNGEWNHLWRWEALGNDKISDLEELEEEDLDDLEDGESDESDDSDDKGSSTMGDRERVANPPYNNSKLNKDQIIEIANDAIAKYTDLWKPTNKGVPKKDRKNHNPESLWTKAEAAGKREQLVHVYEEKVRHYEERLDRIIDHILENANAITARETHHLCSGLKPTVDDLTHAQWLLDIYRLPPLSDSEQEELYSRSPSVEQMEYDSIFCSPPRRLNDQDCPVETWPNSTSQVPKSNTALPSSPPKRNPWPDSMILDTVEDEVPFTMTAPHAASPKEPMIPLSEVAFDKRPQLASMIKIRQWKWPDLVGTHDRKRVVSKAVFEMKSDAREIVRNRLDLIEKRDLFREIHAGITMLCRGHSGIPGVLPPEMSQIMTFTRLFLCWWLCNNYFRLEPSQLQLDELVQCLEEGISDLSLFYDYLSTIMTTTFSAEALEHPYRPSQHETVYISSDDDEPPPRSTLKLMGGSQREAIIL